MLRVLLVCLALAGCSFPRASEGFACSTNDDCGRDRVCTSGFCVLRMSPEIDAPPTDMTVAVDIMPDARLCEGGDARATDASGACFVAILNADKNWQDAETDCISRGMHLAAVRSDASNDVVQTLVAGNGNAWIGGNDMATEMAFVWVSDGTPFVFDNFRNGVPNNGDGGEDCVVIEGNNGGAWDDQPCGNQFEYVCGFEP